ncbi:hypothetical protein [Streptomyces sp. NPDC000983]|uniref:hypothetical protein n=1 Tax=Streptomyces sp. NPDC000983 TaxID=3154373 RepID=UPI0033267A3C
MARFHAAAAEVLAIAVDEMRHLRWVNEIFGVLGRPHRLDPPPLGMVIQPQPGRAFELQRLTAAQLDWFVQVEKTSDGLNPDGVGGMSVRHAHLIKLIIDEVVNHFERFKAVKEHLAGFSEDEYLRELDRTPDPVDRRLLKLADLNYAVLIDTMKETLALGNRAGGVLIEHARRAMTNLRKVNHRLAARDVAPRFRLPAPPPVPELADGRATLAAARSARQLQETMAALDGTDLRAMMTRHRAATEALIADLILVRTCDTGHRHDRRIRTRRTDLRLAPPGARSPGPAPAPALERAPPAAAGRRHPRAAPRPAGIPGGGRPDGRLPPPHPPPRTPDNRQRHRPAASSTGDGGGLRPVRGTTADPAHEAVPGRGGGRGARTTPTVGVGRPPVDRHSRPTRPRRRVPDGRAPPPAGPYGTVRNRPGRHHGPP